MKLLLQKVWDTVATSPCSFDDYVGIGRWLVCKKLLVLLGILFFLFGCVGIWLLVRPEKPFTLPVFYDQDNRLKTFSGEAILIDEHGAAVYCGQIVDGLCTGRGRQLQPPDETLIYEGDFLNGRYSGQGKLYRDGSLLYEGGFLEGLYSGSGIFYQGDSVIYQGQFSEGFYSGSGCLFEEGALLYQGEFQKNLYEGSGRLYDPQGALLYAGSFSRGLYDGEGTEFDTSGRIVYQGGFRNGRYDGMGCLYSEDGRLRFQGTFVQGVPNRSGSLYNAQGQLLYSGNILNGKADFLGLLGLPVSELREQVKETPVLYYGDGYVGYFYQELGFACICRYDYTAFRALDGEALYPELAGEDFPSEQTDSPALFAQPADNLVANLLLVAGAQFFEQVPQDGSLTAQAQISGFEAFIASRLAGISDPLRWDDSPARTIQRGEHLYEVQGLPERSMYGGIRRDRAGISYIYREEEQSKGGVPGVIFLQKNRIGG